METKLVLRELRIKNGYSQKELAEKVFVTRQAVSRWEAGETMPNTETLKLLSKLLCSDLSQEYFLENSKSAFVSLS